MTREELFEQIKKKKSFLCVGLDSDIVRIPRHLLETSDPLFNFNKEILDATHDLCVSVKINIAFYESLGVKGWESMEKTVNYIRNTYPELFIIADAKRGDIGNTSQMYARAFFENLDYDSVTVAPYMGSDSVKPFLTYLGKWVILLALTSNKGADDFQYIVNPATGRRLFEEVIETSKSWGDADSMMYVVGATRAEMLTDIRKIVPDHFLLVPGVGAQGGSLQDVAKYGLNSKCGLLVNASRSILYASDSEDFATKARENALELQLEMAPIVESI